MSPYLLSLFLFLVVGLAKGVTANASSPILTANDCIQILLQNDNRESILKKIGFKEIEVNPDDNSFDDFNRYVSKNGIVIEFYGSYGDTGADENLDIYFSTHKDVDNFMSTTDSDWKWEGDCNCYTYLKEVDINDEDSGSHFTRDISLSSTGRLVQITMITDYRPDDGGFQDW